MRTVAGIHGREDGSTLLRSRFRRPRLDLGPIDLHDLLLLFALRRSRVHHQELLEDLRCHLPSWGKCSDGLKRLRQTTAGFNQHGAHLVNDLWCSDRAAIFLQLLHICTGQLTILVTVNEREVRSDLFHRHAQPPEFVLKCAQRYAICPTLHGRQRRGVLVNLSENASISAQALVPRKWISLLAEDLKLAELENARHRNLNAYHLPLHSATSTGLSDLECRLRVIAALQEQECIVCTDTPVNIHVGQRP
mmetsp:Transcript_48642/g.113951  ORF Transcript_48642/g.113951 Transcript_48642/m.113951 type:complete len:249 (+) Transcript_48642:1109-1855(+)